MEYFINPGIARTTVIKDLLYKYTNMFLNPNSLSDYEI